MQTQRLNWAVQWLQQQRSAEAVVSELMVRGGISRRQAYRYLLRAQNRPEVRPLPARKSIFTVNLPHPLIQALRARCRRQGRPISHVVEEILQQWLATPSAHG